MLSDSHCESWIQHPLLWWVPGLYPACSHCSTLCAWSFNQQHRGTVCFSLVHRAPSLQCSLELNFDDALEVTLVPWHCKFLQKKSDIAIFIHCQLNLLILIILPKCSFRDVSSWDKFPGALWTSLKHTVRGAGGRARHLGLRGGQAQHLRHHPAPELQPRHYRLRLLRPDALSPGQLLPRGSRHLHARLPTLPVHWTYGNGDRMGRHLLWRIPVLNTPGGQCDHHLQRTMHHCIWRPNQQVSL